MASSLPLALPAHRPLAARCGTHPRPAAGARITEVPSSPEHGEIGPLGDVVGLRSRNAVGRPQRREGRVGRAEADAADALAYADWTVYSAQLAILDAIDARAYADELAKAGSSGTA